MTELELLEMLSGVQGSYIQQADAFREGRLKIAKKKRPVVTALKSLSVAAVFVLILGAGYFGLQNLAAKEAAEKTGETLAAQSGAMAEEDTDNWQRMALRNGIRFYSRDFENSYTLSEFRGELAKRMGTEEVPKPARYAKLDMDGDGIEELVVEFDGTGDLPRLVLGSFDGQIMGEIYYERQMSHLKADGVFYASGGIGNRSWARLQRSADGWTVEDLEGDYTDEPDAVWTQWVSLGTAEVTNGNSDTTEVTPELLGREAKGTLTFWQDGVESSIPADLFIGDGYSVYIPQEGWVYQSIDWNGISADQWVYADETLEEFGLHTTLDFTSQEAMRNYYEQKYSNRLTILFYPGMDDHASREWVCQAKPEWNLVENARGNLYGDNGTVMFLRTEVGDFICIQESVSFAAGEGIGVVGTMYQSFCGWPSELTGYAVPRDAEKSFELYRYIDAEQRGEDYTAEFQLYRASGYSTYVPKEGFSREETTFGGLPAEKWVCREDPDVWFMVVSLQTVNYPDAIQWGLSAGGADYALYEDKSGGVSGENADGTAFLSIQFPQKNFNGIYGVIQHFPMAEIEDLRAYVQVMADEFIPE